MRHDVTFGVPTRELGKADIHFWVKGDGKVLGKLEVSNGSIVWYPKDARFGHKASWSRFEKIMKELPLKERRKARRARK